MALLASSAAAGFLAPVTPLFTPAAQGQGSQGPLVDPGANVPRTAAMEQACGSGAAACQSAVLAAIDQARAGEGVGPLVVPSYYGDLTTAQQLLVLADHERVDRGLPGFTGLSSQLDALALQGATSDDDPDGPNDSSWGSNWAGGEASALLADYDWMYDDGPGSPNLDCTHSSSSGCWDHRQNILGDYGPHPSMGAAATTVKGVTSLTELFSSGAPGALDYSLPEAAPVLVSPLSLQIGTTPAVANSAMLTVSGPSRPFRAAAKVAGDEGRWSVTPACVVRPGQKCHLFVTFVPAHSGRARATVTVHLPGRVDQVGVSAYAGDGFWRATARGAILASGGGGLRGSAARIRLARPVVGMAATPNGGGYWEVAADGGVFSYGDAKFFGSAAPLRLRQGVVGMAPTHDGHGYWLVTRNGSVYSFGDARYYGTPAGRAGDAVVGMAPTPDGHGYWLVTRDGSVYSFGDAR
ncbi:MAG: hypothetical protein ACRDZX_03305, partial [Acidimicrobiales bacterium]